MLKGSESFPSESRTSGSKFGAWWYQANSTTWTQAIFGQSQLQCLTPHSGNRSWPWPTLGGQDIMASLRKLCNAVQKTMRNAACKHMVLGSQNKSRTSQQRYFHITLEAKALTSFPFFPSLRTMEGGEISELAKLVQNTCIMWITYWSILNQS